jgi:hypothetical protein
VALVLDANTHVTVETAEAVLRRGDNVGLAIVAAAMGRADANYSDWIGHAVRDVFGIFADRRDAALRMCAALSTISDPEVRAGLAELIDMLTGIEPVLRPA